MDILFSVQRLHCPEGQLKSKGKGKVSIHFSADPGYSLIQFIALFFLSISSVSTEQWQLYARNLKDHQDRKGQPCDIGGTVN